MARALYGYTAGDFGVAEDPTNSNALIIAGSTIAVYDTPGGTPQTDLLDAAGDAASDVVTSAGGTITFQGPDGWDKDLYGTPDSGTTWYRFPPSTNTLVDRVAAVEAGYTAPALDGLTDVNTAGAADGDSLVYNSSTGVWAPDTIAGGGAAAINDLTDVTITSAASGNIIAYNGSAWVNGPPAVDSYGLHLVTWNGSAWRYRGATVTARPTVATYANGGYVMWDTSQHAAVTTAPSLAIDGDKWHPHPDVTPA